MRFLITFDELFNYIQLAWQVNGIDIAEIRSSLFLLLLLQRSKIFEGGEEEKRNLNQRASCYFRVASGRPLALDDGFGTTMTPHQQLLSSCVDGLDAVDAASVQLVRQLPLNYTPLSSTNIAISTSIHWKSIAFHCLLFNFSIFDRDGLFQVFKSQSIPNY